MDNKYLNMTFKFNSLCSQLLKEANLFNKQKLIDTLNFQLKLMVDDGEIKPQTKNWFLKNYVKWYESPDGDTK